VQTRDVIARDAADGGKISANQDLSIRLERQGDDGSVWSCARVKRAVERAIGVEARHARAGDTVERGKSPANEDSAIRLQRDPRHPFVRSRAVVEGRVQRAFGVETADGVARYAIDRSEGASYVKFTVG